MDLSEIVKEYGSPQVHMRPHPVIQADVLDGEGNLRAADIGSLGRTTKLCSTASGWLDRALHDQLEWDR